MGKIKIAPTFESLQSLGVEEVDAARVIELAERPDLTRSERKILQAVINEFGIEDERGARIFVAAASWLRVSRQKILDVLPTDVLNQFELPREAGWSDAHETPPYHGSSGNVRARRSRHNDSWLRW